MSKTRTVHSRMSMIASRGALTTPEMRGRDPFEERDSKWPRSQGRPNGSHRQVVLEAALQAQTLSFLTTPHLPRLAFIPETVHNNIPHCKMQPVSGGRRWVNAFGGVG